MLPVVLQAAPIVQQVVSTLSLAELFAQLANTGNTAAQLDQLLAKNVRLVVTTTNEARNLVLYALPDFSNLELVTPTANNVRLANFQLPKVQLHAKLVQLELSIKFLVLLLALTAQAKGLPNGEAKLFFCFLDFSSFCFTFAYLGLFLNRVEHTVEDANQEVIQQEALVLAPNAPRELFQEDMERLNAKIVQMDIFKRAVEELTVKLVPVVRPIQLTGPVVKINRKNK